MVGGGWTVGLPLLDDDAGLARSVHLDEIGRTNASFEAYRWMYAALVMEWLKFMLLLLTFASSSKDGRVRKTRGKVSGEQLIIHVHGPASSLSSGFLSLRVCYLLQKSLL